MKVKIVKSTHDTYWYANQIGRIYTVKDTDEYPEDYQIATIHGDYILKADCVVVDSDEAIKGHKEASP